MALFLFIYKDSEAPEALLATGNGSVVNYPSNKTLESCLEGTARLEDQSILDQFLRRRPMSEHKTVVWFGDDQKPNTFFLRSPFRSWAFLINTGLLVVVCLLCGFVMLKSPNFAAFSTLLTLLLLNVVYPYWGALRRHARVNELYLVGKIVEEPAECPQNILMEVADNSMNEGLRNASVVFGLFLLCTLFWKLHYFK
jgi:hypothetical protein